VCICLLKAWPEDALEMVANKFLEDVDMEDSVRSHTITMCKHFHESVRLMSQKYYDTLRRHNYVTPTSYLELILTFKNLLSRKRDDIIMLKNRYLTGLEKLQFAASQVCIRLSAGCASVNWFGSTILGCQHFGGPPFQVLINSKTGTNNTAQLTLTLTLSLTLALTLNPNFCKPRT